MPQLTLIVAADEAGTIGVNGRLPWHLPNDLKHFKALTLGHIVLMGRKTWDSIGRPLPGRDNWVLSRSETFSADGARVFSTLDQALAEAAGRELMVIGGSQLYLQALPRCKRIHLTRVRARLEGDTWFPAINPDEFREVSRSDHPADALHAHAYSFLTLERQPVTPSEASA